MFEGVKYYFIGNIENERDYADLLDSNGAKRSNYLSSSVTHAFAQLSNDTSVETEVEEAKDIHDILVLEPIWISISYYSKHYLPYKLFATTKYKPFKSFNMYIDDLMDITLEDKDILWLYITLCGGNLLKSLNSTLTHFITDNSDINETTFFESFLNRNNNQYLIDIITPDWIYDVLKNGDNSVINIEHYHPKYLYKPPKATPSPQPLYVEYIEAKNDTKMEKEKLNNDQIGIDKFETKMKIIYYGHDENFLITPYFLIGCKMYIDDYTTLICDKYLKSWKKVIIYHGGYVVDKLSESNHVVTPSYNKNFEGDAELFSLKIKYVTAHWLNDCIARKHYHPPWKFLHLPLPSRGKDIDIKFKELMSKHVISISNYEGDTRTQLKHMIWVSGAQYTWNFSSSNTLLISKSCTGQKYESAKQFGIPIVNEEWLIDVLTLANFPDDEINLRDGNLSCSLPPFYHKKYQVLPQSLSTFVNKKEETIFLDYSKVRKIMKPWETPILLYGNYFENDSFNTSLTPSSNDITLIPDSNSIVMADTQMDVREKHQSDSNVKAPLKSQQKGEIAAVVSISPTFYNRSSPLSCDKENTIQSTSSIHHHPKTMKKEQTSQKRDHKSDNGTPLTSLRKKQLVQSANFIFKNMALSSTTSYGCTSFNFSNLPNNDISKNHLNSTNNNQHDHNSCNEGKVNSSKDIRNNKINGSPRNVSTNYCILITGFTKEYTMELTMKIQRLGGEITENPLACSHLVVDSVKRTIKFFCALSHTKHIVKSLWVLQSFNSGIFLDEHSFTLKDDIAESTFNFCLKTSLYRAQHRGPLFSNISFYLTPNVEPSIKILKPIVESAGGNFIMQRPSTRQINLQNKERVKLVIISCLADLPFYKDYIAQNISMHNVELITTSLIQQNLNFEQFAFK